MEKMRRPLIVAHRGVSRAAPENTLAAFEAAIRLGADLIECDLRITADGHYVIAHDSVIGGKPIGGCALREVKGAGRAPGYDIPTLGELLDVVSGRICLDLELKEGGYESDVVHRLLARLPVNRFVVTSFLPGCLQAVKRTAPQVRCGLLLPEPTPGMRVGPAEPPIVLSRLHESGIDFLLPHWKLIRFGVLQRAVAARLPAWVWTVNAQRVLKACRPRADIDAVITDEVELALKLWATGGSDTQVI